MNDEKITILVSSKHLGLIIGKGGSRIKEISEEFQCRISINRDQTSGDNVPVDIEGSEKNIIRAKLKIDEITKRQFNRHQSDHKISFHNGNYKDNGKPNLSNNYQYKKNESGNYDIENETDWGSSSKWSDVNDKATKYNNNIKESEDGWGYDNCSFKDNGNGQNYNLHLSSARNNTGEDFHHGFKTSNYNNESNGIIQNFNFNSSPVINDSHEYETKRRSNAHITFSKQKEIVTMAGNDDDNWGGWGKTSYDVTPMDSLIFPAEESLKGNFNVEDSYGKNIPEDDDWGIPSYMEEEKPIRKRPINAQLKMKTIKDAKFYPVHRNFYREHPNIAKMTSEEKAKFLLAKNNIIIKEIESETGPSFSNFGNTVFEKDPEELIGEIPISKVIPNPITTFDEAFFNYPDILKEIHKQKFDQPSPIQCIAWPILMSGRDFIGIAQTGTGKTLAFLLPAFIHIEGQPKPREQRQGPTVLILSPTRELAIQIQNEVQKYTYHDIDSVVCYGGADKRDQIYQLKEFPEIVVGTPGRIQDLKDSGILNLKDVSYLVLDEADRMLDMGFEIQVVNLIYAVRRQRQTVMTSATWPFGVQRIALTHMKDPVQVNVGTLDLNACHSVRQIVEYVEYDDKTSRLIEILSEIQPEDKIIIFVSRKAQCSELAFDLYLKRTKGLLGPKGTVRACEIHGDLDQQEREMALKMMRSGARNVMIATDVASRGLDIVDLTKVINYDFPKNIEEYVHRVGRTGRAGRTGEAITFMNRNDWNNASELIKILEDGDQEVPDFLLRLVREHHEYRVNYGSRGNRGRGGGGGRNNRFGDGPASGGGGGGGYRTGDRDGGPRRGGTNNFNRNRFDDMDNNVQTDSSWQEKWYCDDGDSSLVNNCKTNQGVYLEDIKSDDDDWGNWDKVDSSEEREKKKLEEEELSKNQKIVEISSKKVETLQKQKIDSNHAIKPPHIRGNKDLNLYPIRRNFYEEHPDVSKLSSDEVKSYLLERNNIMIKELKTCQNQSISHDENTNDDDFDEDGVEYLPAQSGVCKPIRSFPEMFWKYPEILNFIDLLKFETPSPIQCIGWPVILSGRDFIGIAQTGSGKTLTFVLPALIHIEGQVKPRELRRGPTVLILSPTRELAIQIECEIAKISYHGIKTVCCYGGAEKENQIKVLRDSPEIVVGTPGRINDLMRMGCLNLKDVSYLVLDEADRMLDMGFEPQIVSIINETRKQRQSIMTSATWPECVWQIALFYMDNPVQVNVGSLDLMTCTDVVQEIKYVNNSDKTNELCEIILHMKENEKLLVFVTRKVQCRSLYRYLARAVNSGDLGNFANICEIHGDMSQEDREQSWCWFRDGTCTVLISTNVASRGLDVADITCVVNYDFPKDIEEYVHRVGRTGRAGKQGKSITFMNEMDSRHVYDLNNILIQSNQTVPSWLLNLKYMRLNNIDNNLSQNSMNDTTKYNGVGGKNRKRNFRKSFSKFDNGDFWSGEEDDDGDFFDHYQRDIDPKMNDGDNVLMGSCIDKTDNGKEEKPLEKKKAVVVEESVIEYHNDLVKEIWYEETEDDFNYFDECSQKVSDRESENNKFSIIDFNSYDMEYESENDECHDWW